MATVKELNHAIRIMKEHCLNQTDAIETCDGCLLKKVCEKIECSGGMPFMWDEIKDEDGK